MSTPESVKAALAAIDKRERESKVLSVVFAIIVCAVPLGLFFSPKGQPMINIVLIALVLYNTLLGFWIKRDLSAHAARILRAMQDAAK